MITVEQYHRMIEAGILTENDPVELLEGVIVQRTPQSPPHACVVSLLLHRLAPALPEEWLIRVRCAITTSDSEPEPDLAIVRGPERPYFSRHPLPRDIGLVVEVADTSLDTDRTDKGRLYARARIPVYWVVNLIDFQVEVYTNPRGGRLPTYRQHQDYGRAGSVPLVVAGSNLGAIAVRELLP